MSWFLEEGTELIVMIYIIYIIVIYSNPSDSTAKITDNSTKYLAQLMSLFIKSIDQSIEVVLVHSTTNLFRYDENICKRTDCITLYVYLYPFS